MKQIVFISLLLSLTGCTGRVPTAFSTMDLGIGATLVFSGPERRLTFNEDLDMHDYGRNYRLTLVVDGGTAAQVAIRGADFKHQWNARPQYWDKKNRAVVDIDGRPYPLVDAWKQLSEQDERFVLLTVHGQRCGTGAALAADGCPEQEFYLRTSEGIIKGPFVRPKGGDPLDLGADYTVTRPHKRQIEYQKILDSIILPDINFESITAEEAIIFLDDEFKRLAPGTYLPIRLNPNYDVWTDADTASDGSYRTPVFSCAGSGISLLDALEITCTITRTQFYVEDKQIIVSH